MLGGGFAGIGAAQKLHKSDVDVVLGDKHDYHTFQPLLYQVATGLLEQPAVGHPIRDLFDKQENVRVHQEEVTAIDLDGREVRFAEVEPLGYDYLVLGLGASPYARLACPSQPYLTSGPAARVGTLFPNAA